METRNGLRVYRPVNLGYGRTGWECYQNDCTALATGVYKAHSGAHYRACAEHAGRCHETCWSS
jgi:hypothetical protein